MPVAFLPAAGGCERLEDGAGGSHGEARTRVFHHQQDRAVLAAGVDADVASRRRVADGVVDQVVDGLTEPNWIDPGLDLRCREGHEDLSGAGEIPAAGIGQ